MNIARALPLLVLGFGLVGCEGFPRWEPRAMPGNDGQVLEKLEASKPAQEEKLPEIVSIPASAPAPVVAPLPPPVAAATRPATTLDRSPDDFDQEIVLPRPKRTPKKVAPRATSSLHAKTYTVQRGDTLQKISQKFYGTTRSWLKIYDANKGKIKAPDRIVVGMVLTIP